MFTEPYTDLAAHRDPSTMTFVDDEVYLQGYDEEDFDEDESTDSYDDLGGYDDPLSNDLDDDYDEDDYEHEEYNEDDFGDDDEFNESYSNDFHLDSGEEGFDNYEDYDDDEDSDYL